MAPPVTTCQICGRVIKANTGLIAHHGYQRPDRGSGWQTASCFGARYRPYEVACDALPPAIKMAEAFRDQQNAALAELLRDPPKVMTINVGTGWRPQEITVERPERFDPTTRPATFMPRSYGLAFWDRHDTYARNIRDAGADIKALNRRLADWEEPATRAVAS